MKIVKFFEIFITLIVLFNKNNNFINCNNDEGNKNTNIYLSKCDKSYNFLENPPKFSDASDSLAYEYAQKKIFDIDLNTLHISLIKNLQFSKFRNIIDVKSSIFNCIIKTVCLLHFATSFRHFFISLLHFTTFPLFQFPILAVSTNDKGIACNS